MAMPTGAVACDRNGESRGVYPSAYWGFFSVALAMRKEKALISYGFLKSQANRAADITVYAPGSGCFFSREADF